MIFLVAQIAAGLMTATAALPAGSAAGANSVGHGTAHVTWARATRALRTGDTLRVDDITMVDTVITWRFNTPPDSTRPRAGWIARRPIAVGEFMRLPAVAPAPVIIMGSIVQVMWTDGAVQLLLKGVATNNAALGAPVGVRIDKNRRLDGIAVGPNSVRLR